MDFNPILIILLVVAVGVVPTVLAVQYILEAAAQSGCKPGTPAPNASKGRCFRG